MRFNRQTFFLGFRAAFGPLDQGQVDGLEFLLGAIENDPTWKDLQQVAYFLATTKHETANTFQPIKEFRARAGTKARANQDRYWLSGFHGRGYIQLTWKANYEKFGIASTPEKALEPETAFRIASRGMQQGVFTGKKLSDFIHDGTADYLHARQIVNAMDKAKAIANIAEAFERILTTASGKAEATIQKSEAVTKPVSDIQPDNIESDKGVTTSSDKPAEETAGTQPPAPAAEVKASQVSWVTKVSSLSIPAGVLTILAAIGNYVSGLPPYVWVAFSGVVVAAMIIGFQTWKVKTQQAHERTLRVMSAAADKDQNNLRLI